MPPYALPESLIAAARQHRLVPFAGAGVSMSVRRDDGHALFPSWHELLLDGADRLTRELDAEHAALVKAHASLGDYLEAARRLKEGLRGLFTDWVRQALSRSASEAVPETLALPRLLWELGSRIVLTTNYDLALRWACPRAADLEEWSRIPPVPSAAELTRPTVWHLHGSITRPAELVLSEDDYRQLYEGTSETSEAFRAVLRDVLRNRTVLFVGFSLDDGYLQAELAWLQKSFRLAEGRHYLLVTQDRFAETRKRFSELTSIEVIPYPAHGEPLLDMLALLRDAAHPATAPAPAPPSPPPAATRTVLDTYLDVAQEVSGLLAVPGMDRALPVEQIWVQPRFIADDGAAPLHRILARRAVVIQAPAGAGKSTLSRVLVTILARDRLKLAPPREGSWQRAFLNVEPGDVTEFPLFVNLRNLDPAQGAQGIFRAASPALSDEHVRELQPLLERGEVAFIMDGLDEAPLARRGAIVNAVLLARARWKSCYFLLTTRSDDVPVLRGSGFAHARLAALSPTEGATLLERWAAALNPDPGQAEKFAEHIRAALGRAPELRSLLGSPLSITFICWNYHANRRLPTSRAALYASVAEWLLQSRADQRLEAGIDLATTRGTLEAVGYLLLSGVGGQGPAAAADLHALVPAAAALLSLKRATVESALRLEIAHGSCLVESQGRVSFWHANLRDYFAARWLTGRHAATVGTGLAPEVERAIWSPAWQETSDIFVGLLGADQPERVQALLDAIDRSGGPGLPGEIRRAAVRSHVMDVAVAHGYQPPPGEHERQRAEFVRVMQMDDAQLLGMGPRERIAAFVTLGALQMDQRLRGKPIGRALSLDDGSPVRLGRYPVTVQEFARFVRAGGYDDVVWRRDFRDLYWKHGWRAPLGWDEQKRVPNAAVVGISWHEAMAYCRWLTHELGGDWIARLPEPDEWMLAVNPGGCESVDWLHHAAPPLTPAAPVGIFPERRGPGGHDDMCGLVWEWLRPLDQTTRRRRRLQVTGVPHEGHLHPLTTKVRGARRSPNVGFRVVFVPRELAEEVAAARRAQSAVADPAAVP